MKACNSRAILPQIVYTRPPFAGGFRLLLAVNLLGAGGAVFCPARFPENPRGALAAAVEFGLRLLQGEVQPNCAVRLDVAVLPGNACSIQQQRIEHLGVVADAPQGFVLEKQPRQRYIGRRWALRRELAKSFYLTSYPIHPIRCIDWIDRLILLRVDLFLIS